jgi:hypothetical protein
MKLSANLLVGTLLIVAIASIAFAGSYNGHGCGMSTWNMIEIDANGDGVITFEEFSGRQQERLRAGYDMIDGNKNGVVDEDEWSTFLGIHGMKGDG